MHLDRLIKIRNHLRDNVKDEQLYMSSWSCGTSCCVMGHACSIPEFAALGLRLIPSNKHDCCRVIQFQNQLSYDAVSAFLDTDLDTARSLFGGIETTKQEMLTRLDEFITTHSGT